MRKKVLAIDNDDLVLKGLEQAFSNDQDIEIIPAASGPVGIEILKQDSQGIDLILLDWKMPFMMGDQVARELKQINPDIVIAMLSGECEDQIGQLAMDAGAAHFIVKGSNCDDLVARVRSILATIVSVNGEAEATAQDNTIRIRRVLNQAGRSRELVQICDLVEVFAPYDENVLIHGESGSGKEGVALAIHTNSGRKGRFVPVNCAAIPRELLESELFGHEKGSFTGAIDKKIGLLAEADGGTIFFDEIGDMAYELQSKVLRTLNDKVVQPIGGKAKRIDFRVVSATHCPLEEAVIAGKFRADLYYRLKTFTIDVPPLRDRPEDIEPLFWHFVHQMEAKTGKRKGVSGPVLRRLKTMAWPGNVRDLASLVKNAFARSGKNITMGSIERPATSDLEKRINSIKSRPSVPTHKELMLIFEDLERWAIGRALTLTEGKKGLAAAMLDMNPNTLNYRLVKLGMETEELFWNKNKKREESYG